jgi:tRNA(adenine34) deaminase
MTLKNMANDKQHQLDQKFMKLALKLAKDAENIGEVPVAAVIVDSSGKILSKATNLREKTNSVLGHAELVAIHRANQKNKSWRLNDCTLYVTLEPCFMCAAALVQSRIARVVFAAHDPKGGAIGSLADFSCNELFNHQFSVTSGVLAEESSLLLKNFFKLKRSQKKIKV